MERIPLLPGSLREEPFRLFFPLAALGTLGGVMLWPLLHHGLLPVYPGVMHARIMTVGVAGFLIGFLCTSFPRLIDGPALRGGELALVLGLWLAALGAHFSNLVPAGDGLFALVMVVLGLLLAGRWLFAGRDTPPPGLPVALVGLLLGGLASGSLAWQRGAWMGPAEYRLAHLMLYQGMALLGLIGVGPYVLPRLLGLPSSHRFDQSAVPPAGWWTRFGVCAAVGITLHVSLVVEAEGDPRWGMGLRAGAVLLWVLVETPLCRRAAALTTPGTAARVAVLISVLALGWAAADSMRRVGILHLFFVSGLGLMMLGIGVRVALGHAGRHDLLEGKITWLRVVIGLTVLAAATRASADFLPRIRVSHLDYAAVTWMAIVVLWLWRLGRWFFVRAAGGNARTCPKSRERTKRSIPGDAPRCGGSGPGR